MNSLRFNSLLMMRREDIVSVTYQAWLLVMSSIAIFTQSIPHIGSSFVVHVMAFVWSSIQLAQTQWFAADYRRMISGSSGACNGIDIISDYFAIRTSYQIATTVINFISLIASAYLTWRLFDVRCSVWIL